MNILQFLKKYPDEQSCKNYLKELRQKQGIFCDKCKCITKHWWLNDIEKFQCSKCNSRTNLRSGTIMEKSKVPVHTWFMCIHLMTTTKKPFSCLELQRQLGIKKYETTQLLMNKVRLSMGKRDEKYKLNGVIEMDDCFIEVVDLPVEKDELGNDIDTEKLMITKDKNLKRGRGSQGKQSVLVFVESKPRPQTDKYRKKREMGYVKMVVIGNLTNNGVNYEVQKSVNYDSNIISDKYTGFSKVSEVVKKHTPEVIKPKESMEKLP